MQVNSDGASRERCAVVDTSKSALLDSTRHCQMLGFDLFGEFKNRVSNDEVPYYKNDQNCFTGGGGDFRRGIKQV
jgi:hypothetical protein